MLPPGNPAANSRCQLPVGLGAAIERLAPTGLLMLKFDVEPWCPRSQTRRTYAWPEFGNTLGVSGMPSHWSCEPAASAARADAPRTGIASTLPVAAGLRTDSTVALDTGRRPEASRRSAPSMMVVPAPAPRKTTGRCSEARSATIPHAVESL